MATLRPAAFRNTVELPDGRGATGRLAWRELWETPSDLRAKNGTRAWACLQVSYSSGLGQWVPSLRRVYTRTTGAVREVEGTAMQPMRWNVTGTEDVLDAARLCASQAKERLVSELLQPKVPIIPNPIAVSIFIPADVLQSS